MSLLKYHQGPLLQRGHGIGSIFKSIFKLLSPGLQSVKSVFSTGAKIGKKVLSNPGVKDVMNTVRNSAIEIGVNTAADAIDGLGFKESLNKNVNSARSEVADSFRRGVKNVNVNKVNNPPQKRRAIRAKKSVPKKKKKKKVVVRDIFDDSGSE